MDSLYIAVVLSPMIFAALSVSLLSQLVGRWVRRALITAWSKSRHSRQ